MEREQRDEIESHLPLLISTVGTLVLGILFLSGAQEVVQLAKSLGIVSFLGMAVAAIIAAVVSLLNRRSRDSNLPPRWFGGLVPREVRESALGDLDETFGRICAERGLLRARLWYASQILGGHLKTGHMWTSETRP